MSITYNKEAVHQYLTRIAAEQAATTSPNWNSTPLLVGMGVAPGSRVADLMDLDYSDLSRARISISIKAVDEIRAEAVALRDQSADKERKALIQFIKAIDEAITARGASHLHAVRRDVFRVIGLSDIPDINRQNIDYLIDLYNALEAGMPEPTAGTGSGNSQHQSAKWAVGEEGSQGYFYYRMDYNIQVEDGNISTRLRMEGPNYDHTNRSGIAVAVNSAVRRENDGRVWQWFTSSNNVVEDAKKVTENVKAAWDLVRTEVKQAIVNRFAEMLQAGIPVEYTIDGEDYVALQAS